MFCYDIEYLLKILDYGKQNGLNSVVYTGGDPFAYGSDINKLISFHLENEISIGFVTAGYIPSGVNFDLLKKCDVLIGLQILLYSFPFASTRNY
jgi:organic radical activating enzyme